jgi:hypothetical protein
VSDCCLTSTLTLSRGNDVFNISESIKLSKSSSHTVCDGEIREFESDSNLKFDEEIRFWNGLETGVGDMICQVCGDKAAGFYCGAFACEACKVYHL